MKILFVCSCLEPGMDGVGDYTRRLAVELTARGHPCRLLALADAHVDEAAACEFGDGHGGVVMGLRLPASQSWPERVRQARSFCASFAPDWLSWQIVLYGFDRRGLSFGLGRRFAEIAGAHRNHIMFHEIWIGNAEGAPAKQKLLGQLQRSIIKDLLRRLRPKVVHTHTPLYRHLLGQLGVQAVLLPLFGNIPIAPAPDSRWLQQTWPESGTKWNAADRGAWWVFVMFGSIHPEWDEEDFWRRASEAAQRAGKKCLFLSIGRPGPAGAEKLHRLQRHEGEAWRVLTLGRQPEAEVSQCLLAADFGASPVPPEYAFKSGTIAAMLEHGLPVVATRPVARYPHCPPEMLTAGARNIVTHFELETLGKTRIESLLPAVATQLIEDLQRA